MRFMPPFREPSCIHSHQPASACTICKDGPELAKWLADWEAWMGVHPIEVERLRQGTWFPGE